jgi:hypothetical protein
MPDSNGFGMRGFAGQMRPEVERPNFGNQVGRPLLIGLVILTALNAIGLAGAILCAWLVGPPSGALLGAGALLYGIRVSSWWPLEVYWNERGRKHAKTLGYLLLFAAALLALERTGNWPRLLDDPSQYRLLWQTLHYEAGRVYWLRGDVWQELHWLQWARWATVALIPLTLPKTLKLLWYRFSVSTVYPTWDDSVSAQGRRVVDPLGLIQIDNSKTPEDPPAQTSAPQTSGML